RAVGAQSQDPSLPRGRVNAARSVQRHGLRPMIGPERQPFHRGKPVVAREGSAVARRRRRRPGHWIDRHPPEGEIRGERAGPEPPSICVTGVYVGWSIPHSYDDILTTQATHGTRAATLAPHRISFVLLL